MAEIEIGDQVYNYADGGVPLSTLGSITYKYGYVEGNSGRQYVIFYTNDRGNTWHEEKAPLTKWKKFEHPFKKVRDIICIIHKTK